ncbi:cobyrinate a,c-diamide synthase [Chamaesiphon minutus]|uniref:Cobyrinate a,c-diamide synthase n=1 Tax=Chamaesiphon minutus (strain ATCC 27169 / PCC 6605) TaxID=1173020 RepID=K9UAL1_CHAP6|nr:cobyrinate a,c-diamide synthase [Chamaesiphon minutus]AFY91461.1 cobyrinic acid a,c-diamide synthase [Chamaesiphon minutus PCC 6605]
MSIAIAGERSGVGKTTITLALLAALKRRQQTVQSFKVGPDYIDPMFHSYVTGRACRNLDPILTSPAYVRHCFDRHSQTAECAIVEGVMGLFDGASGTTDAGSTAQVAKLLNIPVVLILNCSSTSRSIAAIAHGYRTFDPEVQIAGVILNRVGSDRHLELLTAALLPLHLPILGVLRRRDDIILPDRHLGLIPAGELTDLDRTLDRLADVGETCFDWERLMPLLVAKPVFTPPNPPAIDLTPSSLAPLLCAGRRFANGGAGGGFQEGWGGGTTSFVAQPKVRLAIAKDAAFNFYYADNLDLLRDLGAELVEWSPLIDRQLPPDVSGLYFGGGFPEVFAEILAANTSARQSVAAAITAGMPTYAECGGLMYLCDRIVDFDARSHAMVGIFPTTAVMGKRLILGYRQLTALQNSVLFNAGDRVWGHEFHRSTLTDLPPSPLCDLHGYESNLVFAAEGWSRYQVQAAYTHLHFGSHPNISDRFLNCCRRFDRLFASQK